MDAVKQMTYIAGDSDAGRSVKDILERKMNVSARMLALLKRREDGITVNGKRVTVRFVLSVGDRLVLSLGEEKVNDGVVPVDIPLDIIFENDDMVVVNKPPYMPTHQSHGHTDDTLANALAFRYRDGGAFIFRAVNRLDRNTSGTVLVARNKYSSGILCSLMKERKIKKTYYAILDGIPDEDSGVIDTYIRRREQSIIFRCVCSAEDEGAERAITEYRVIGKGKAHSLVRFVPHTGRTHQLRVHSAYLGCPIMGDGLYGAESDMISRHALHAAEMIIPNSNEEEITFCAPMPQDMSELIRDLGIVCEKGDDIQ